MKYHISFDDVLDHSEIVDTFDDIRDAAIAFKERVEEGPDGYINAVELIQEDDDEEFETLEYHEWMTEDEWNVANPTGYPE